jgi:hypothetical protein
MLKLGLQIVKNGITIDVLFLDLYIYSGGTWVTDLYHFQTIFLCFVNCNIETDLDGKLKPIELKVVVR